MGRLLAIVVILGLSACATGPSSRVGPDGSSADASGDAERLALLWQARSGTADGSDFAIGPGDVLEIAVPGLDELESHRVRVAGDGTIALPLIGSMQAAGRTEGELRRLIYRRLEARYMYDPPVNVFVTEYQSRMVGVIGAVEKPGFYPLTREADTLLDAIALAGGMSDRASPRLVLIPAPADGEPAAAPSLDMMTLAGRDGAISIEISEQSAGMQYLNLPVRPGDVLVVHERGEVLVQGWVRTPGSYPITPALTVLGAVAAAGGTQYAANPRKVKVYRASGDGARELLPADLRRIERGEVPDIDLEAGDVIQVRGTIPKMVVTGIYRFIGTIFSVGFGYGL